VADDELLGIILVGIGLGALIFIGLPILIFSLMANSILGEIPRFDWGITLAGMVPMVVGAILIVAGIWSNGRTLKASDTVPVTSSTSPGMCQRCGRWTGSVGQFCPYCGSQNNLIEFSSPPPFPFDTKGSYRQSGLSGMDDWMALGMVAGSLTTAGFVPQLVKGFRTKSMGDVSLVMPLLLATGMALWLGYGVLIESWPIIFWNAVALILNIGLIVMKTSYAKRDRVSIG
jgi:MtN3 and saliva related transmembrane protein